MPFRGLIPETKNNTLPDSTDIDHSGRFVILIHDHPQLHWDFMLEADGVLKTWRLAEEPGSGRTVPAELLPDHRIEYLDYEGPVSGDRGTVHQFDAGTFTRLDNPSKTAVRLAGKKLNGFATAGGHTWLFS